MKILKIIGWILIVFGVLDFGLYYLADLDLTGVSWSPYVAGILGSILISVAEKKDDERS